MSEDDNCEPSTEDVKRLQRYFEAEEQREKQLDELDYDGVVGTLPDWVPEWFLERFRQTRARLLKEFSHNDLLRYLNAYERLGEDEDDTTLNVLKQAENRHKFQDVGFLAHLRYVVSLGEIEGLRELAGGDAVSGRKSRIGGRKGGKRLRYNLELQELVDQAVADCRCKNQKATPGTILEWLRTHYTSYNRYKFEHEDGGTEYLYLDGQTFYYEAEDGQQSWFHFSFEERTLERYIKRAKEKG